MSLEVDEDNETDEESLRCAIAMSIEVDEDHEPEKERLRRGLYMLMEEENNSEEIGCLKRKYSLQVAGKWFRSYLVFIDGKLRLPSD
jgi:hypothetical protein